jgi:hypothetical protein
MTTVTRKIGTNRDKPRLWLEGSSLSSQGWRRGDLFNITFAPGSITLTRHPQGQRKVAGKGDTPIIDTNTDKITEALGIPAGAIASIQISPEEITIKPESGTTESD